MHPKTTPLVCSIIFPDDKLRNLELVKWGRDSKGNALKAFYAKKGVKHIELKLEKAGLFLDKNRTYIGASSDGIIYCKCHGKSIMQVKCLYNIGNSFIKEDIDKCSVLQRIMVRFPSIKDINITHMLFHKYNSLYQIKDILWFGLQKIHLSKLWGKMKHFGKKYLLISNFFSKELLQQGCWQSIHWNFVVLSKKCY